MIHYIKTNSDNTDFHQLATALEAELKIRDGENHVYLAALNAVDILPYAIVAYDGEEAVGCGALRTYGDDTLEVKRMYVPENRRGQGIASGILQNLEQWAIELQYKKILLETSNTQPEAIALYKKKGYRIIPNFGKYADNPVSVCFEKILAF